MKKIYPILYKSILCSFICSMNDVSTSSNLKKNIILTLSGIFNKFILHLRTIYGIKITKYYLLLLFSIPLSCVVIYLLLFCGFFFSSSKNHQFSITNSCIDACSSRFYIRTVKFCMKTEKFTETLRNIWCH